MSDTDGVRQYAEDEIEMRFEPLEVTPQLLMKRARHLFDTPIKEKPQSVSETRSRACSSCRGTAGHRRSESSEISVSSEPRLLPTAWDPPEVTWARVSIFGYGFEPGVPVLTKWNNTFGFPDNGVGRNSILLQFPVPRHERAVRVPSAPPWSRPHGAGLALGAEHAARDRRATG